RSLAAPLGAGEVAGRSVGFLLAPRPCVDVINQHHSRGVTCPACRDPAPPQHIRVSELVPRAFAAAAGNPRQEPTMPRKRCTRPTTLTSSEKKTRRQIIDKRVAYTRIYLGNQIGRWLTLREKVDFKSDTDLAGFLLDL
ncbi:hypothetical protein G0U57_000400, partial [Chelydra serpentina]